MSGRSLLLSIAIAACLPLGAGCLTEPDADEPVDEAIVDTAPAADLATCTDDYYVEKRRVLCPVGPPGWCTYGCTQHYRWDSATNQCVTGLKLCAKLSCDICPSL